MSIRVVLPGRDVSGESGSQGRLEFELKRRKRKMKFQTVSAVVIILLSAMAVWAQEFPRAEVGGNYSYVNYNPSSPYSQTHSLNGGGGELNFNINEFLGIKMDLQGYASTLTGFNIPPNPTFPAGAQGHIEGNLFT